MKARLAEDTFNFHFKSFGVTFVFVFFSQCVSLSSLTFCSLPFDAETGVSMIFKICNMQSWKVIGSTSSEVLLSALLYLLQSEQNGH